MKKLFVLIFLFCMVIGISSAFSADRYFIAGGVDNDWTNSDNWSASSGGGGGETVPAFTDNAFLDANSPNCLKNGNNSCWSLVCTGYTNTLTMTGSLAVYTDLTFVAGMTFVHNNETVSFKGSGTTTSAGKSFGTLNFSQPGTRTHADDITVVGDLVFNDYGSGTYTINGNKIYAQGHITHNSSGTLFEGTTIIEVSGAENQNWTQTVAKTLYFNLPVIINKSGGNLTLVDNPRFQNDFIYTAGIVDAGTSNVWFQGACTVTSNGMTWNNFSTGNTGTVTLGSACDINGNLVIGASTTLNAASHQMNIGGNWTNNGTFTHGNNTVVLDKASGTQTIDGSSTFYNFTCQTAGLTLEFDNTARQTVANILTLEGGGGGDLTLVSDSPSTAWELTHSGASSVINYVDVADSDNSLGNEIDASSDTNTDGGGNTNWSFGGSSQIIMVMC